MCPYNRRFPVASHRTGRTPFAMYPALRRPRHTSANPLSASLYTLGIGPIGPCSVYTGCSPGVKTPRSPAPLRRVDGFPVGRDAVPMFPFSTPGWVGARVASTCKVSDPRVRLDFVIATEMQDSNYPSGPGAWPKILAYFSNARRSSVLGSPSTQKERQRGHVLG